ncbi:MAG: carbohydrate-binding family 9-like protein [Eubacteriales bacterium]
MQLRNNLDGSPAARPTELRTEVSPEGFRFHFSCRTSRCHSAYDEYNRPIYEGDVCEIFLTADPTRQTYYEIEVAPNGTVFFARVIRQDGKGRLEFLPYTIVTRAQAWEDGYEVAIEVPYASVGMRGGEPAWYNAYRIETDGGHSNRYLMALNPTLYKSFHRPEYFVPLVPLD